MHSRKLFSTLMGAAALFAMAASVSAQDVIKIGELNSYKTQPAFLGPYKKGMELAVEQINAAGGVNGKSLQLVIKDDNSNPGDAVRAAEELLTRDKVDVLAGTFLSHIGLAVTDFAKHKKQFFLASEPLTNKIVWADGNRYTYRLRNSTYMQVAMLIPAAVKMNKKRWAIVYPNYEYGQSAVATFKTLLKQAQPDVEFVAEQAATLGKIDAANVVQALADAKPEAMFNVLFATDLSKFVRAGTQRNFFKDLSVVSMLTGEPEYLAALRAEAPDGSVLTSYPW
jgi:branched-chain amino acid transport system substrate-binding protein